MTPAWSLVYDSYDPADEGLRETLCALGNGYFVTRGAAAESAADGVHYPGTYVAGGYDRLVSPVAGRDIENEDLVNLPNWLPLTFRVGDGPWFDLAAVEIIAYRQELDLRRGVLTRSVVFRDPAGRESELRERRFVDMADKNLAGLETTLVAKDWSGPVTFLSALDGTVVNAGVPRYRDLAGDHLEPVATWRSDVASVGLVVETRQSRIRVAEASRTRLRRGGEALDVPDAELVERPGYVGLRLPVALRRGEPLVIEKMVTLATSRERAISEPACAARSRLDDAGDFDEVLAGHVAAWDRLWRRCATKLGDAEDVQRLVNLHTFHVLQTVSPHSIDLDAGVPARGLHGEAYRGHIFWDELYIVPFLTSTLPDVTRALLLYRYRRLPAARRLAREAGFRGAMFPWQSGSDGREETQIVHLNPKSGRWLPDNSRIQRHVNIAIVYNIWLYFTHTLDTHFLSACGAEMLLDVARFLASLADLDETLGRYRIRGVMGPDEYHDGYPGSEKPGIDDNAYTNVMTVWALQRGLEVLDSLPALRRDELVAELALGDDELSLWEDITRRMYVPFHGDGIMSQFEGYGELAEFDWEGYRAQHGDIARLDRILEAEGDTPNRYRVAKQADLLMLFYLLPADGVRAILAGLGYELSDAAVARTIDYYAFRTSHGSTLSLVAHTWLLARRDPEAAWALFIAALQSDVHDIQGGTTREGVHVGVMAGTVDLLRRAHLGLVVRGGVVEFDPCLPSQLKELRYALLFRGQWVEIAVSGGRLIVGNDAASDAPVTVSLRGRTAVLAPGQETGLEL